MGFGSPLHWIILLVVWSIWIIPLYKLLGRIGWSQAWAFVAFVPPLAIVLLWVIAFSRWNSVDADSVRDGIR